MVTGTGFVMVTYQIRVREDALKILNAMKDEIAALECRPVETVSYTEAIREMHRRMRGTPLP